MNVAFLGPEASFTSLVSRQLFPTSNREGLRSIRDCFLALKEDRANLLVVPLENSIEGTVSKTLDYLYEFSGITIVLEAVMPIEHLLLRNPQSTAADKIISHPQALAQCNHFLQDHYPTIPQIDYQSTAAAAKLCAEHPEENILAIASRSAANTYGLEILRKNIQDFEQNHTKFIVVSIDKSLPTQSEIGEFTAWKTALIISLPNDHPGGLHQVLSVFAWRKMNLTKIESRTLKTGLGNYFFYVNVEGTWDELQGGNAILELESIGAKVKFLGCYKECLLKD